MSCNAPSSWRQRLGPTWTLLFLAPLIAEVLSGSTRFRALFVFPVEMCVWGGGAVLIRHAVRRFKLGWAAFLALALALALAEETVIQQSSLAPLVIMLKGQVYARTWGVNYLYLIWALVYECVYVVFVPICLTELLFPGSEERTWMGNAGVIVTSLFFVTGSALAWFMWTHVARVKVFHQALFVPPMATLMVSILVIATLLALAFGPLRRNATRLHTASPPAPWLLAMFGVGWSVVWYAILVLAFGIAPWVPPSAPSLVALGIAVGMLILLPRWTEALEWTSHHSFWLCAGSVVGLMAVSFVGFLGAPTADLYFKVAVDTFAVAGLGLLWRRQHRQRRHATAAHFAERL
jgi:hypothetical protein